MDIGVSSPQSVGCKFDSKNGRIWKSSTFGGHWCQTKYSFYYNNNLFRKSGIKPTFSKQILQRLIRSESPITSPLSLSFIRSSTSSFCWLRHWSCKIISLLFCDWVKIMISSYLLISSLVSWHVCLLVPVYLYENLLYQIY